MTDFPAGLQAHLNSGATTLCRCWRLTRRDGVVLGFTDHDANLVFDGVEFVAETGMSARALSQTTGLSVDNSEAMGALTSAAVTEEDILAGRYDDAEVNAWLVNWQNTEDRVELFAGNLGEIARRGGAFQAELRGLTEKLNVPQGRAFQRQCPAVLGDGDCRFDLTTPGYFVDTPVQEARKAREFVFSGLDAFAPGWFAAGALRVLDGPAAGLVELIKFDKPVGAGREIELWEPVPLPVKPGTLIRLEAGCDKRPDTCRNKFSNFSNFQGFPHLPNEDWLVSYPSRSERNDGGSLQ